MRTALLTFFLVFGVGIGTAWADDKETVDTGKGLTFQKVSGWAAGPKKKGAVATLKAAGEERSEIEFRWAAIETKKSKQYFNSFHASLTGAGLKRVGKAVPRKYGTVDGTLTEYEAENTDGSKTAVFVYEFTNSGAAWLIVGMFQADVRDPRLGDLEKMLATIAVSG